jgi:hypothetical protein
MRYEQSGSPFGIKPSRSPIQSVLPVTIAAEGDQAAWRHIEFFTVNIRNSNTRKAYARAAQAFLFGRRRSA